MLLSEETELRNRSQVAPGPRFRSMDRRSARILQRVIQEVTGSIPVSSTNFSVSAIRT